MTPKRCPVSGFLNHKTTESKWVYIYIEYQPEPEHQPLFHWHMMDVFFLLCSKLEIWQPWSVEENHETLEIAGSRKYGFQLEEMLMTYDSLMRFYVFHST